MSSGGSVVTADQCRRPIVAVCGPTASGKSDVALELAAALDGEIVNVDSVQVYRGFDIGSAKLAPAERRNIPHHLIDVCAPGERWNAAAFAAAAWDVVDQIQSRRRTAILAGGTGLYLSVVLHGIADLPAANAALLLKSYAASK